MLCGTTLFAISCRFKLKSITIKKKLLWFFFFFFLIKKLCLL